ncbi:non-homologous end joining protein Ku [Robbsia andropogonis]|uniref:non-homologous end joining protein Ku n=1 Tax=Robbsia andropogonis TaxID=28092 RepID=UPI002A6B83C3|nr:Ku protein [Robbsia andropogonis]
MAKILWKGAIAFGLVHVPVQLYPATRASKPSFHLLDGRSLDPIGYRQYNKRTGKDVPRDKIVRGFEYEKEHFVGLSDDELRAANPKSTQSIDVMCFVPAYQVNFVYLDTPYRLMPDTRGEKVFKMFREALDRSGKIGIALVVMHERQHLCALVPTPDGLSLTTLRWAEEVLDAEDDGDAHACAWRDASVSAREREMAVRLIDDMTADFTPDGYKDRFRDDVLALVERKIRAGKTTTVEAVPIPTDDRTQSANILDLTALLKRSLGQRGGKRHDDDRTAGKTTRQSPKRATSARKNSGRSGRKKTGTGGP